MGDKSGRREMSSTPENVVVVAVRAEREISKTALAWALTHVVRPGDVVTLLAVLTDREATGWRRWLLWGFPRLGGDRRSRERCPISASCSQMALQIDGRSEINVRIKVVGSDPSASGSSASTSSSGDRGGGVVVAESKRVGANWVVLDKQLKQEEKHCMEELQCNIVVIKGSCAKVLRLNLGGIHNKPLPPFSLSSSSSSHSPICSEKYLDKNSRLAKTASSPVEDAKKASPRPETKTVALSSNAAPTASFSVREHNPLFEKLHTGNLTPIEDVGSDGEGTADSEDNGGGSTGSTPLGLKLHYDASRGEYPGFHLASVPVAAQLRRAVYWIPQNHTPEKAQMNNATKAPQKSPQTEKHLSADHRLRSPGADQDCTTPYSSDVREAVSLFGSSPSVPPPLCSLCRHKAPVFGKPPRRFTYRQLEVATDGFADATFVAEGGGGLVHRGFLEDGRVVAVKRLKAASCGKAAAAEEEEEEEEFCEEVEVLSRAQHRNVVMLVGFCVEGATKVLVYEYICNGSLDLHLYGQAQPPLDWIARMKTAVGVARGLRYLHEDCRVGFVVHKDLRPNNILLTHDFEPLLGDFRLTRWQTETSRSVDTNVPEAFGYLAPEYIEHGIVTDKSDVYAFGVVLLELITGRRALDTNLPKGQQFLVEWARPLLSLASEGGQTIAVDRFLDPRLDRDQARFFSQELRAMARAASLCLRREPQSRPGMSKVLRILEGDSIVDQALDVSTVGSRSGRIIRPVLQPDMGISGSLSYRFPREAVASALCADTSWPTTLYESI
ncbi:STYKc [Musa troglodytarum]|uniref:STYKc n=1 Tax=Musa troglodytarum TaxID=320322 RepID=A0A9E7H6R5_9LILI|nr:STYKc [Musa troglodytarum]